MAGANRIALGSAQFGLDYGVNNKRGMVSVGEAGVILERAWECGIDTIDTAHAYGQSESTIGEILARKELGFRIVTKFDPMVELEQSFQDSLRRLQKQTVYGYLVHSYEYYEKRPDSWAKLRELRSKGYATRIGFSLYYPAELESLIAASVDFDIVQIPYSIFDRRFESHLGTLRRMNIDIHVRSAFLQGLAFMDPDKLPNYLLGAAEKLRSLRGIAAAVGASTAEICLQFVLRLPEISKVVIGVDSVENLLENVKAVSADLPTPGVFQQLAALAIDDERLIVPVNWSK